LVSMKYVPYIQSCNRYLLLVRYEWFYVSLRVEVEKVTQDIVCRGVYVRSGQKGSHSLAGIGYGKPNATDRFGVSCAQILI
jgi:hypothetical protein